MAKKTVRKRAKRKNLQEPVTTEKTPDDDAPEADIIPQELRDRCKKVGISDDQIRLLGTPENVKAHCDLVSPQTNPDSMPKRGEVKEAVRREPDVLPDKLDVAKDDIRQERQTIESVFRKLNIKYKRPPLKSITKIVVYDCEKKQVVVAKYEIKKG